MKRPQTYPLPSISIEEATKQQFKLIDAITHHFTGLEVLSLGDLGILAGENKPAQTIRAEKALAEFFDAEAAILVRGSGSGALRWALISVLQAKECLLVHKAPIYTTTKVSLDSMGIQTIGLDYNNLERLKEELAALPEKPNAALIQLTRQKIDDSYDFEAVIQAIKQVCPKMPIITDDNYAAFKLPRIGCQAGADLSVFSTFKTLGPEGVGLVLGKKELIEKIHKYQYSGGSQVQGHEAMAALRGMVYAPVALAIQAQVCEEIVRRINGGELPGVRQAFIANAQSKVVLLEFEQEIASRLLEITPSLGASAHPVGSESIYEITPMIYRISGTFREYDSTLEKRMIRINPMRSGADTVIRILREALQELG